MGLGIDGLKVSLGIFVVPEFQNSPPQLLENEEHVAATDLFPFANQCPC